MKKILFPFICLFLIAFILLPCEAKVKPSPKYDYNEYLEYVNEKRDTKTLPGHFTYYGQISILGDFICFDDNYNLSYKYRVKDDSDNYFTFELHGFADKHAALNNTVAYLDLPTLPETYAEEKEIDQVMNLSHMIYLKPGVYKEGYVSVTVGELTYYYINRYWFYMEENAENPAKDDHPLPLSGIYWIHNGKTNCLSGLSDYPTGQDTLVGRLLNYETAEAALAELTAFMDANVDAEEGALKKARQKAFFHEHMPLLAGGGIAAVIVIPTAIALPIVIVKRKRKKKAALAGGGENADISRDDTAPNPPTDPG